MKYMKWKKIGIVVVSLISASLLNTKVSAQEIFPETITNLFNLLGAEGGNTSEFVSSRIQALLLIGLGVIVLAAVIYAGLAALKYIRSQGDPGQVEEAGKAVKAIFLGLAVLLLSIVGIVLIFVFFGAEIFNTNIYQTCLSAPSSQGCTACSRGGLPEDWETVRFADDNPIRSPRNVANEITRGNGEEPGDVFESNYRDLCAFCEWEYNERGRSGQFDNERFASRYCGER
jgi:hypothetical protein